MKLTIEQQRVVEATENKILVLACPGSGKTATMVERYAWRAKQGVSNGKVALVTFTSEMAKVLKNRIHAAGAPEPEYVGTLHGLCYHEALKERPESSVVDEDTAMEVAGEMIEKYALKTNPKDLVLRTGRGKDYAIALKAYHRELERLRAFDYEALLEYGIKHGGDWGISELYVDEVQDTGEMDEKVYASINPDVFVAIGDTDQAIYSFRGATDGYSKRMVADKEFTKLLIQRNFRSDKAICRAANNLISKNPRVLDKEVIPVSEDEGKVLAIRLDTATLEAMAVRKIVGGWLESGVDPNEIAVLTRYNKQADGLATAIAAGRIPVRARKQDKSSNRKRRIILAALRATVSPSPVTHNRLRKLSGEKPVSGALWRLPYIPESVSPQSIMGMLENFGDLKDRIWVKQAWDRSGSLHEATLDLLSQTEGAIKLVGEGVTVGTIHSAKGQEWDNVILAGMEQEITPRRGDDQDKVHEERRLAFVGITRARRRLVIAAADERMDYMGKNPESHNPSQFIAESGILLKPFT